MTLTSRRPRGREPEVGELLAVREPARRLDEVDSGRLAREGHRARGARVRLEHVDGRVGDRELDVEQPDDAERRPEPLDDVLDLERVRQRQRLRREHARRVAGVHARLLDVLHDRADEHVVPSQSASTSISIAFSTNRSISTGPLTAAIAAREVALVVADAHRAPAEDVRRADEHRVADLARGGERLVRALDGRPRRAADAEVARERAEQLPVLGEVDRRVRRAEDPVAGRLDVAREPERRLPAELRHDAVRPLAVEDGEHLLGRERLEVEAVGRVVVGRDGLGVAVDHHRLVAERAERLHGVDAAVVELDPLTDPVRARSRGSRRAASCRSAAPRPPRPRSSRGSSTPPRPRRRTSRRGGRTA